MFGGILTQWVGNWKYSLLHSTCPDLMVFTKKYQEIDFSKTAPVGRKGAPGDCGSFAGVSGALLCF
jgi:hypothetical protein